jgi:hypothetical protein
VRTGRVKIGQPRSAKGEIEGGGVSGGDGWVKTGEASPERAGNLPRPPMRLPPAAVGGSQRLASIVDPSKSNLGGVLLGVIGVLAIVPEPGAQCRPVDHDGA